MNRTEILTQIRDHAHKTWDIIVIGGGATGAGIAFDAVARGFDTLLLEQEDFGKGTSSRSTKLLHGGVRYLAQGDLVLVFEALRERGLILKNAPHLTSNQEFLVPAYSLWDVLKYIVGLKFYDLLSGRLSLGKSRFIGKKEILARLPNLRKKGLKGGVIYHDGQFDDSRLLIALILSVIEKGGLALNYCKVTGLLKDAKNKIRGVEAQDAETAQSFSLHAKVVVNATGVFTDDVLKMDHPLIKRTIRPSQGIHLVLDRKFLPGRLAIMIPRTDDGRVLFAIPWYDKVVVGTTDTPVDIPTLEPKALKEEISFILRTAARYLSDPPQPDDVLSVFAGLRPLVASLDDPTNTREISRRHKITISSSGLVTVEGGKWTIYRRMAQDTMERMMKAGMLEKRPCPTQALFVYGANGHYQEHERLHIYGIHARDIAYLINSNAGYDKLLHPGLPYSKAEFIWVCRHEMPGRIEDVLARRTRALLLDAKASRDIAPQVASIMAAELGFSNDWEKEQVKEYGELVKKYLCK